MLFCCVVAGWSLHKHPQNTLRLEWAEHALFSGELGEAGGRVCTSVYVFVGVCFWESVCLWGSSFNQLYSFLYWCCQPDDSFPLVCAERLQIGTVFLPTVSPNGWRASVQAVNLCLWALWVSVFEYVALFVTSYTIHHQGLLKRPTAMIITIMAICIILMLHPTVTFSTQDEEACMVEKRHIPLSLSRNAHPDHTQVTVHTVRPTHCLWCREANIIKVGQSGHPWDRNVSECRKNAYKGNTCRSCCWVEGRGESHWARICQDLFLIPPDILAACWRLKGGRICLYIWSSISKRV